MDRASLDSGKSLNSPGRFMYADYSPLEDDRNLVEVVKEFVALASRIGRLDVNNRKLAALASDSDRLRQDIISAIKHIKTNTTYTMEKFSDEHADLLSNELLTKGAALLMDTKRSLSELLASTETGFDEHHTKYREKITTRIAENNTTASNLIQAWLSNDTQNLPRTILSHINFTITAAIDKNGKNYEIIRNAKSASVVDGGTDQSEALQFGYSFRIDPADLEFWNYRRNVTELGIKDLMLPIGMEAPVSEKIKQKFRFGSRKDAEVMKQPEFVKADGYFLVSATLMGDKTLMVELAREASSAQEGDRFRISYNIASLVQQNADATFPKIDYSAKAEGEVKTEFDVLQIPDVRNASDLSKIRLLGASILTRTAALQDPQLLGSRSRMVDLRIRNDDVVIPAGLEEGKYDSLFAFLKSIAQSYSPFVKNMLDRTPMKGELALKEEIGGGQRKEYSVRVEDLKSQLGETRNGEAVAQALGL